MVLHLLIFNRRVLFFPYGNNVDHVSFYLEHGFEDRPPDDWYSCVQFVLVLWNKNDPTIFHPHSEPTGRLLKIMMLIVSSC